MPRMAPVYFQANRWLYEYLREAKGFDPKAYNNNNVTTYLDKIQKSLDTPIVRMAGVAENGLSFEYTRPYVPQGELLEKSCGDPGKQDEAGSNPGTADYATLRNAFKELFENDKQLTAKQVAGLPWFSIIDTNSAHHLSAPLVERAARAGPERPLIVVNFDAHVDYGSEQQLKRITCQSWGVFVTNKVEGIYTKPLAQAYVQFGGQDFVNEDPHWGKGRWHGNGKKSGCNPIILAKSSVAAKFAMFEPKEVKTPAKDAKEAKDVTIADQLDEVVTQLFGDKPPPLNAYVSLDRDVMQQNFTPYNDGRFPAGEVIREVDGCLNWFKQRGAELVGFDVTGLPAHPGQSNRPGVERIGIPEALDLADGQLTKLWLMVAGY